MREIVLDTETTGLSPLQGHRVVEIGCVELSNRIPTGRELQIYINPERDMPAPAFAVHGLSRAFLSKFPIFSKQHHLFSNFVQDAPLIIHNASFDMNFLQAEFARSGQPPLKNKVVDTLMMARKKFPGMPNTLSALCKRFSIDDAHRDKHGALLDSLLLARVYLDLTGGAQLKISLKNGQDAIEESLNRQSLKNRIFPVSDKEDALHAGLIKKLRA